MSNLQNNRYHRRSHSNTSLISSNSNQSFINSTSYNNSLNDLTNNNNNIADYDIDLNDTIKSNSIHNNTSLLLDSTELLIKNTPNSILI